MPLNRKPAPAGRRPRDGAVALLVAAVLAAPLLMPPGEGRAAPAEPSLDERWVFDELNAHRRKAGAPALTWDATAYESLRATRLTALIDLPDAANQIGAAARQRRGLDVAWLALLRRAADMRGAVESALADDDLLARQYTQGAAALATDAGGRTVLAVYVYTLPPLLRRANLNGPAGHYRVRCPACRRERVYSFAAPRGFVSMTCPTCRTLLIPHLEDTRGALHWPTWFVRPYAPFALDNPFLAWKWVNEGVLYDHPKADRDQPGWQTAAETAQLKTGVCRDTAVLLAAWLHDMGHAARVVTGHRSGPHAWVILAVGETRYLLETASDGTLGRRYPPRLELETDYVPTEMMFDAQRVWLNRGQQETRDYDSPEVWTAVDELP